jgi:hypothetical protein
MAERNRLLEHHRADRWHCHTTLIVIGKLTGCGSGTVTVGHNTPRNVPYSGTLQLVK